MGDAVVVPQQVSPAGAPAGINPIAFLQAQLNRYVDPDLDPKYQIVDPATNVVKPRLTVNNVLDDETASRAISIVLLRAAEAGNADLAAKATAAAIFGRPDYVQANLPFVTDTVKIYGDIHGVPAATGPSSGASLIDQVPTWAWAAGVVAAYFLFRKGR